MINLTINLYPSYSVFSKWIWGESLLCLLYWIVFLCLIKLWSHVGKWSYVIVIVFSLFLMYATHQRSLVIFISLFICCALNLLLNLKKEQSRKRGHYVFLLLGLIAAVIVAGVIKNDMKNNVYSFSEVLDINDFSGISRNIFSFDINMLGEWIKGLLGKIWYFFCGTYGIGMYALVNIAYSLLKERKIIDLNKFMGLFATLSVAGLLLLNNIFMNGYSDRHDTLIYGKTHHQIINPFFHQR